jgi:hypothetical protein
MNMICATPMIPQTEVRGTKGHGAGRDRDPPGRVAAVTDLDKPRDEEPMADCFLTK